MKIKLFVDLARAGFIIMVAIAIFNGGIIYEKWGAESYEFQYHSYDEAPEVAREMINDYNNVKNIIYFALIFLVLYYTLDYFNDRENHFITAIDRRIKKWQS